MIRVRGVEVWYDALRVLRGISAEFEGGCFTGVLGPNGAGKSTLLRAIAALVGFRGRVELLGREVREMGRRELARRLSVVPQEFPHELEFSALEVVAMGRYPHQPVLQLRDGEHLRAAGRALERVGASELAGRRFRCMSSGERQRVLIARALAQEAEAVLLDEPTSNLDLRHSVEVMELLRRLAEEGRCVIACMHNINLASLYCDRLVLMRDGRVAVQGTPEEVVTPEVIREVYGCDVCVVPHPVLKKPQVHLIPRATSSVAETSRVSGPGQ